MRERDDVVEREYSNLRMSVCVREMIMYVKECMRERDGVCEREYM